MHNLRNLLRTLAGIYIQLADLTNQAAKHSILVRIKDASQFGSTDYIDVADFIDSCIGHAELSAQDVDTLRRVSARLYAANEHMHLVQDALIVKDQFVNRLSFPNSGE